MILWTDERHGAAENMRRDTALLARAEADPQAVAVLRLYGFAPAGITLGLSQAPERELDLEACRRDGVEWAVRPTGGRAIYHDEEWTYALAARLDDPRWGGTLREAYAKASTLIAAALGRIGIAAEMAGGRRESAGAPGRGTSAPCFASTARHEILLGGRKLVGSAQRRTARALLQQGSILLGPAHRRLADYLAVPAARERARTQLTGAAAEAGPPWRAGEIDPFADAVSASLEDPARHVRGDAGLALLTRV